MIDKGRLRRAPMVALAGLGGAGIVAAALWLGTGSGTPVNAEPAGAHGGPAPSKSSQPVPCTTARLPTGEPSPVPAVADPSQVPTTPVPCPTAEPPAGKPSTPEPSTPEPSTPEPSTPEPSAGKPSAPEPSAAVPSPVPPGSEATGPAPAPATPTPTR